MEPKDIPAKDFPLIVLADHSYGWVEFAIKMRTQGEYNHIMTAIQPNFFASQGRSFARIPFESYMKKGNRLKFVEIVGLTEPEKIYWLKSIGNKLNQPWYKKRYDWLGILGQAIGIKKVNSPWSDYCSEDVVEHIKNMAKAMPDASVLKKVLLAMPDHESPQGVNEYIKANPDFFKTYLRWESDEKT